MTDLRQAAQQALEAWDDPMGMKDLCVAMDALRTALEQQAEPVLQTCNCRWDGDVQVQQCTLHEAHVDAIHEWAERAKVAERKLAQQAEPVSHAVIVGALFDFMGWLTTRKERLILSSTDNASPAADAIKVFAEMRGLSLDDALVQDWQNYTTPPQQQAEALQAMNDQLITGTSIMLDGKRVDPASVYKQAEPVAWDVFELRLYGAPQEKQHRVLWVDRYIYPDGSTPDLDDLLKAAKKDGGIDGGAKTLHVRPLYDAPLQRQWVGLTDEEITELRLKNFDAVATNYESYRAIEAKLKEKNSD